MPPADPDFTRKWSICMAFSRIAACGRAQCKYSHTLLDTNRIVSLVGDVSHGAPSLSFATTGAEPSEQTLFLVECNKYSAPQVEATVPSPPLNANPTKWRFRLLAGGRASLSTDTDSVSVQPMYPVKGQGSEAIGALAALEGRVFGQSPEPDADRRSLCRAYVENRCTWKACTYSHTFFDIDRVEALLDEAVTNRGYQEYKPIVEIEYVARRAAAGDITCVWRITLRCVLGYHQKSAPQPVVVTSAELNNAMRLLEQQFSASSGTSQPSTPNTKAQRRARAAGAHHHRGSSTNPPRPQSQQGGGAPSTPNAAPRPTTPQRQEPPHFHPSPSRSSPPPSYNEALRGNGAPPPTHDAKRRI